MSYYTKQIPLTLWSTIILEFSWEMLNTLNSCLKTQELVFSQSLDKHITSASLEQFPGDMHFTEFL